MINKQVKLEEKIISAILLIVGILMTISGIKNLLPTIYAMAMRVWDNYISYFYTSFPFTKGSYFDVGLYLLVINGDAIKYLVAGILLLVGWRKKTWGRKILIAGIVVVLLGVLNLCYLYYLGGAQGVMENMGVFLYGEAKDCIPCICGWRRMKHYAEANGK